MDASGSHLKVALLTTRNLVLSRILASLLQYKNHFLDCPIKFLRIGNTLAFRSYAFEDYLIAICIALTYSASYEYSQNSLAKVLFLKNFN